MTNTVNLGLPFIDASQAQKHVTHNEALRILDAVVQVSVLDRTLTAPPGSPADGNRHVVASGATGAWAGQANAIATWQDGAWAFLAPKVGWCTWSVADDMLFVFDGTVWRDFRSLPTALDNALHVGINTVASSPNLLSVKSNDALFTAIEAADGGTGDMRIQVSKEASGGTASVVFSDNFSGRAEFGLVGGDTFKLKVSPDGAAWTEAFNIDSASGNLTLPRGMALTGVVSPAQITADQNDYNPAGLATASVLQIYTDAARNVSGIAGGAEGRCIVIINVGSYPVTLLNESASSSAANRFTLGGNMVIAAKQAAILRYDGTATRWQAIAGGGLNGANNLSDLASAGTALDNLGGTAVGKAIFTAADAATAAKLLPLRSYLAGLTLSAAGSSASFDIAAGVATDSTNAGMMALASAYTKTTSAWAVGSGSGALDTGSIASGTWYHAFLIERTDTGVVDVLVSLSATSPTLPTNYTLCRRIGAMKTDASAHWVAFTQRGDYFQWRANVVDFNTATDTPWTLLTLSVPSGVRVRPLLTGYFACATATSYVFALTSGEDTSSTSPIWLLKGVYANDSAYANTDQIFTNTSAQIRIRSSVASGTMSNVGLETRGWIDRRGKDD